jgi:hypothetical protein
MREARVDREFAEIHEIRMRASTLAALDSSLRVSAVVKSENSFDLVFVDSPDPGSWALFVSDMFITDLAIDSELVQTFSFVDSQDWLLPRKSSIAKIVNSSDGQHLSFKVKAN